MTRSVWLVMAAMVAVGCNQHPVSYFDPLGSTEVEIPMSVDPEENLDLLWVIDNSGSMCQEQAILRENFETFIEQLDVSIVDFHIGVTTTHMDVHPTEPVARPGHLQSQPQPLIGYDETCFRAVDERGEAIAGDYTPVRQLLDIAVRCMETPDDSYLDVTDAEIECALYAEPEDCSIAGRCGPGECTREDLFPPLDAAREIPKVLRSEDYRLADGALDVERLKDDFACMSTVGMRGYGFEKGLGAAVTAVSPELTGGAVGSEAADTAAPNHGLIRDDARFAVVFVTDENDCTHDGRLTERAGRCGDDTCDFWNHPGVEDSPLIEPEVLRDELLANLRATKGDEGFGVADVLVASIHGSSRRYDGDVIPGAECLVSDREQTIPAACGAMSVCTDESYEEVRPTCATALGTAYSGDRYDRFLRSFPDGQFFPEPTEPNAPVYGWMCTSSFRPALAALGDFINPTPTGCIVQPIRSCEPGGTACPAFPYSGEPGSCVQRSGTEAYFCDSYIQIQVHADEEETRERLVSTGFCLPDSFDDRRLGGGCAIDPAKYDLGSCAGLESGLRIQWKDVDAAQRALAGTELELRFPTE